MALHTLFGAIGTGIIIGGYFLEIARLVRTRRSDGVRRELLRLNCPASRRLTSAETSSVQSQPEAM